MALQAGIERPATLRGVWFDSTTGPPPPRRAALRLPRGASAGATAYPTCADGIAPNAGASTEGHVALPGKRLDRSHERVDRIS